jgi:hypothetical protein
LKRAFEALRKELSLKHAVPRENAQVTADRPGEDHADQQDAEERWSHLKGAPMPQISTMYFKAAALFLLVGIAIGLQMSISGEHNVSGAHAHLSLLGWVSLALFGTYFALAPEKASSRLAWAQFWIAVASTLIMSGALYLLLLGYTKVEPVVAVGSLTYAVGAVLFARIVFASPSSNAAMTKGVVAQ